MSAAQLLKPTHMRVQMHRSLIGMNKKFHEVARQMGLKRRNSVVYLPINPGSVIKVLMLRHIVRVDNVVFAPGVDAPMALKQEKIASLPVPGYRIQETDWMSMRPWTIQGEKRNL